jgi:hypothetical protein
MVINDLDVRRPRQLTITASLLLGMRYVKRNDRKESDRRHTGL